MKIKFGKHRLIRNVVSFLVHISRTLYTVYTINIKWIRIWGGGFTRDKTACKGWLKTQTVFSDRSEKMPINSSLVTGRMYKFVLKCNHCATIRTIYCPMNYVSYTACENCRSESLEIRMVRQMNAHCSLNSQNHSNLFYFIHRLSRNGRYSMDSFQYKLNKYDVYPNKMRSSQILIISISLFGETFI